MRVLIVCFLLSGILGVESEIQEQKLDSGRQTSLTFGERYWLFRQACRNADLIGIQILLKQGASVNGYPDYKKFIESAPSDGPGLGIEPSWPINEACRSGDVDTVKFLLSKGAEVDVPESEGYTALWIAARGGCKELVELLLVAGADPLHRGPNAWTAARAAQEGGHEEIQKFLEEAQQGAAPKSDPRGG